MNFTFVALALLSCNKDNTDPCENVVCQNGGTCTEGTCYCTAGYEGASCETEQRNKFIGSYSTTQLCDTIQDHYFFTITSSGTSVSNVVVGNFGGIGGVLLASINGSEMTIPSQTISSAGVSYLFNGSGQIADQVLTIHYAITADSTTTYCDATCTLNE
ncbi:MAG: calcium-binding EGF-like domain-containing protein [Flavobacteriales bacterium]|nr:calcium-binding EGF-like domain-containing protein [Flavobacteriales bacterium]